MKIYRIITKGFHIDAIIWEDWKEDIDTMFYNLEVLWDIYERVINEKFETIRSNYKITYINLSERCYQIPEIWNEINMKDINNNIYYYRKFN